MKKLYIKTFGCQMNEYDSDKMVDVLAQAALEGDMSRPTRRKTRTSSSSTRARCAKKRRKKCSPTSAACAS